MIDVLNDEGLLTLSEAARSLPRIGDKRPHASTIWRWCRLGIKSRSGRRIRLEHVRVGARVFTTADAINDFVAAVAEADREAFDSQPAPPVNKPRTSKQRERAIAQAERELAGAGL